MARAYAKTTNPYQATPQQLGEVISHDSGTESPALLVHLNAGLQELLCAHKTRLQALVKTKTCSSGLGGNLGKC